MAWSGRGGRGGRGNSAKHSLSRLALQGGIWSRLDSLVLVLVERLARPGAGVSELSRYVQKSPGKFVADTSCEKLPKELCGRGGCRD